MPQTLSPSAELLRGEGLPNYQAISPEAVGEGMPQLLAELEQQLEALETSLKQGSSSRHHNGCRGCCPCRNFSRRDGSHGCGILGDAPPPHDQIA